MIKIVIIDDEKQARNALIEELHCLDMNLQIVGEASYTQDAVELVNNTKPNLVLLDIQLGDGTGFQVLEQTKFKNFHTVFITAHNEFAIQAFKTNAIDYILKPVDAIELKNAVEKGIAIVNANSHPKPENKTNVSLVRKRISLQTTEGISLHFIDEIIQCQASVNYTIIHFADKTKLTISKTLKDMEDLLMNNQFERVHQSHLINLVHCKKYINKDGGYVIMSDGCEIPVSQRKRPYLLDILLKPTN
jgi:two-component system, LytTR family, response regulator